MKFDEHDDRTRSNHHFDIYVPVARARDSLNVFDFSVIVID